MKDGNATAREHKKNAGVEGDSIVRLFKYVYIHRLVMGIVFTVVFLSGALYTVFSPPYYESTNAFFFPMQNQGSQLLAGLGLGSLLGGMGDLNSYAVSILKSTTFSDSIIKKYGHQLFGERYYKSHHMVQKRKELKKYVNIVFEEGIIKVTVTSRDPQLSADIANYYLKLYSAFVKESTLTFAKRYRKYVEEQRDRIRKELEQDEVALLAFQEKERLIEPTAELEAFLKYYSDIKSIAILSDMGREETWQRFRVMEEKLKEKNKAQKETFIVLESLDTPELNSIYAKLADKELELSRKLKTMTPDNPEIKGIKMDIESIKEMMKKTLSENLKEISSATNPVLIEMYAEALAQKAKSESVNKVLRQLDEQIAKMPDLAFSYKRLERDVLVKEKLYAVMELELQKALGEEIRNEPEIQILDEATPPDFKVRPIIRLYLAIIAVIALFLSFLAAWVYDKWIAVSRAIEEIRAAGQES